VAPRQVSATRFMTYHTPLAAQEDFIAALAYADALARHLSLSLGLDVAPYSVSAP